MKIEFELPVFVEGRFQSPVARFTVDTKRKTLAIFVPAEEQGHHFKPGFELEYWLMSAETV